jgi:hypothetical protein
MAALHETALSAANAQSQSERCPWCEQEIPHAKFAEISSRIAAKEREQHALLAARLREEVARERAGLEARAREEGRQAAAAEIEARLAAAEAARAAALAELEAQREALEREKAAAVLAEQARAFEERQKLQEKVIGLQKQLENKTAQELGEGPEVDLFEQLRGVFEGDRIRRVQKGTQGADVVHEVVHKGRVCGKIVYDSKNRNSWKSEFVVKLRADQMAERAEHAVLSSNKFPAGAQQLYVQDGVIVAHPARVLVLAELLRRHIVETHELRISNEEREEKTAALYAFITSDRCRQLFASLESTAVKLLELDVAEEKAHRTTWERRNKLIRSVQKAHGDLAFEIERVLGMAEPAQEVAREARWGEAAPGAGDATAGTVDAAIV